MRFDTWNVKGKFTSDRMIRANIKMDLVDLGYGQVKSLRMPSSGMLRRVALVRTDVSEEHIASIITVTIIGELGTMLAATNNRSTLRRNTM
jgi:hypothetical protein